MGFFCSVFSLIRTEYGEIHAVLYKQYFYKQSRAETGKKQANAQEHLKAERYHPKMIGHILKNK